MCCAFNGGSALECVVIDHSMTEHVNSRATVPVRVELGIFYGGGSTESYFRFCCGAKFFVKIEESATVRNLLQVICETIARSEKKQLDCQRSQRSSYSQETIALHEKWRDDTSCVESRFCANKIRSRNRRVSIKKNIFLLFYIAIPCSIRKMRAT